MQKYAVLTVRIYTFDAEISNISIKIIESFAERLNDSESLTTNISLLNSEKN